MKASWRVQRCRAYLEDCRGCCPRTGERKRMIRAEKNMVNRIVTVPVERWYLQPIADQVGSLPDKQQRSVQLQAVVGWLQTILLIIVIVQSIFAGFLRALPPDLRA